VARRNGRLQHMRPVRATELERAVERGQTAPNEELVPHRPVLLQQQDGFPGWADARGRA